MPAISKANTIVRKAKLPRHGRDPGRQEPGNHHKTAARGREHPTKCHLDRECNNPAADANRS